MGVVRSWSAEDMLACRWHCQFCGRAWSTLRDAPKALTKDGHSNVCRECCDAEGVDQSQLVLVNGWEKGEPYHNEGSDPVECRCEGWKLWAQARGI